MACSVLIIGHGTLPKDMITAVEMIYGAVEGVDFICLPAEQDLTAYRNAITEKVLSSREKGLLILADFKGGTPFLTASRIMRDYWTDEIELVTGLNLPMLTEVLNNIGETTAAELAKLAMKAGTGAVTDFRQAIIARDQEEKNEAAVV